MLHTMIRRWEPRAPPDFWWRWIRITSKLTHEKLANYTTTSHFLVWLLENIEIAPWTADGRKQIFCIEACRKAIAEIFRASSTLLLSMKTRTKRRHVARCLLKGGMKRDPNGPWKKWKMRSKLIHQLSALNGISARWTDPIDTIWVSDGKTVA